MSGYTPSLKLILPADGEFSGTWGTLAVNDQITSLVDAAVAGYLDVPFTSPGADQTLTNGDGSAPNQARTMYINMTSAISAARNVIVPTASKLYYVKNSTTGGFNITVKTAAGTGILVPNGKAMVLLCNGTDVVDAVTAFSSVILGTALPVTSGGTGVTTSTGSGSNVLNTSPSLVTPVLGTPTSGNFSTGTFTWPTFNQSTTGNATTATTATNLSGGSVAATTLSASSTVSGVGFSTYLASPPAIGGTAPAAIAATTLSATGVSTLTGGAVIQSLTVGLGANAVASNTALGVSALSAATLSGGFNVAVGAAPLVANTTGARNVAVGGAALGSNVIGTNNVGIGYEAGRDLTGSNNTFIGSYVGTAGLSDTVVISAGTTERLRIDNAGNVISSPPATPPTLATNGQMVMNLTSNTNLRISVRGSDGTTRVANITLA